MAKYVDAAPIVLQYLEEGYTQKDAAEKAGITQETFRTWMHEKPAFSASVHRAKENALQNAVAKVERSLLDRALGYEYEEVRTEYESTPNPDVNAKEKFIPVIKKQSRTKKRVVQDVEAIRFFLTNKAPDEWKNRMEQTNLGTLKTDITVHTIQKSPDDVKFPSSEDEVDAER